MALEGRRPPCESRILDWLPTPRQPTRLHTNEPESLRGKMSMRIRAVALAWLTALAVSPAESVAQTSIPPAPPRAERIMINDVPYAPYAGTTVPLSARVWMAGQSEPTPNAKVEWTVD